MYRSPVLPVFAFRVITLGYSGKVSKHSSHEEYFWGGGGCLVTYWWFTFVCLIRLYLSFSYELQARIEKFFKVGGGWGGKFWKKNVCWYTYKRMYTQKKLDKHATLFLFFLFKWIISYFFALFYYSLFFLNFERGGGWNPRNPPPPPLDPPMNCQFLIKRQPPPSKTNFF